MCVRYDKLPQIHGGDNNRRLARPTKGRSLLLWTVNEEIRVRLNHVIVPGVALALVAFGVAASPQSSAIPVQDRAADAGRFAGATGPILALLWAKEDDEWRITSYNVVTP